jgi:hypothetical protein
VPDWHKDSPQLRANLTEILAEIAPAADQRKKPTLETAKRWQAHAMRNLRVAARQACGESLAALVICKT